MAPTICSEKKPRQIRTNLKEIRRQQNTASASASTSAPASSSLLLSSVTTSSNAGGVAAVSNGSGNAHSVASSIMDYVTATRNMCPRGKLDGSRLHLQLNQQSSSSSPTSPTPSSSSSDNNIVSSTTTGLEMLRAVTTANQMDIDNDITDEEDCEVHSITSGAQRYNNNNNNNSIGIRNQRQIIHCCQDKRVFPLAASQMSNKQMISISSNNNNNTSNNSIYSKRHYGSDEYERNSDAYSSMCENKNTEGLLAIALKTIKLVKRNQMLQRRLTQLQLETSEFIESVLANPENRHFRDKMQSPTVSPFASSDGSSPPLLMSSPLSSPQSPTTTTTTTAAGAAATTVITTTTRQHSQSATEA